MCDNGARSNAPNISCSCQVSPITCTLCDRHDELEAEYGAILLMIDALPRDIIPIRTFNFDEKIINEVAFCADFCKQDDACTGFSVVYQSGSNLRGDCTLVSSFRRSSSSDFIRIERARFYVTPRCQRCKEGFALSSFGCTGVNNHCLFDNTIFSIPQVSLVMYQHELFSFHGLGL